MRRLIRVLAGVTYDVTDFSGQCIVSLTSSLMINSLNVAAKVFSNTLIFLLQK